MNPRALPSLGMGLVITLGLFLLMTTLVSGNTKGIDKGGANELQDFVRISRAESTKQKERELPKRPEPPKRPPTPQQAMQQQQVQQNAMDLDIPKIDVPLGAGGGGVFIPISGATGGGGGGFGDGEMIPIVRIEPQWPRQALIDGISGFVRLSFTVMEDGSVEPGSAKVIESKPPRLFDSSAIRAVSRWKFKPRIVDGKPVRRPAEQTIAFNLEDDEDKK